MWCDWPLKPCGGGPKSGCWLLPHGGCSLIPGGGILWFGWWCGGPISFKKESYKHYLNTFILNVIYSVQLHET